MLLIQRPIAFSHPLTHLCLLVLSEPQLIRSQCFSCRGGGHYASEYSHHTLALEHEPIDCKEETVEPEGSYEELVDVENSLLQGDSHLRVVRCLLFNPVASEE